MPPRQATPPKPKEKDSQLGRKIDNREEKIQLMHCLNSFGNTDFSSMSWFPNMTVPPKFKAPKLEKYNGRGDPMIHLQMYCWKMTQYADNEPLMIQTFQDTLTGHAAEWKWRKTLPCYTHLESAKAGSDSTSSQGAQDLNDLLGLPKGTIFEKSQQRNLQQYNEMMVLESMMPSLDRPRAS
uniref:Retrotransposon gag domain-containing protein n=1 Tax=Fagus sylvatica TaxID=28930 RepID=A0A2N9FS68_FAGSY